MAIIILGAKGMLGRALVDVFSRDHDVLAWDQEELDITDADALKRRFRETRPRFVINAAAFTDVDGAEANARAADLVNGAAVGLLAEACAEWGSALVHYSTDYVFDGENPNGYDEDWAPIKPVNAYGRSKLLGEQALWRIGLERLPFYLIRTSWLYGSHGKNFVDTMLKIGREQQEVRVVNDQHGKPTYTHDLAHATLEIVSGDEEAYETGVYHVTNETPPHGITWYDFAVEIFRIAGMPVRVLPISSREFPRPAARPRYSVLVNTKLFKRRPWEEALREYIEAKSEER